MVPVIGRPQCQKLDDSTSFSYLCRYLDEDRVVPRRQTNADECCHMSTGLLRMRKSHRLGLRHIVDVLGHVVQLLLLLLELRQLRELLELLELLRGLLLRRLPSAGSSLSKKGNTARENLSGEKGTLQERICPQKGNTARERVKTRSGKSAGAHTRLA